MLHLLVQSQTELQLDLKTDNTRNCQKIELDGSLTTEDLKKPHSSRWAEGAEMGGEAWRCSVAWRGSSGRTGGPIFICGR